MPSIGQTWVLASIGAVVEMGILSTLKRFTGRTLDFTFDLSQVPVIGQEAPVQVPVPVPLPVSVPAPVPVPEDEVHGPAVTGDVGEACEEANLDEELVTEEEEKKHVEFVTSAQPETSVDWKKPYLSQVGLKWNAVVPNNNDTLFF
jgi:hypothetical protein